MSIFNEEQAPVETPTEQTPDGNVTPSPASPTNDFADLLGVVVNDKGEPKYGSVPEAIKGLAHSQEHIRNLEAELATARDELTKRSTVEESLTKLTQTPEVVDTPANLSAEDVAELVEQRLQNIEQQKTVQTNTQKVVSSIQQKFGDKAEEAFYGKAKELGMTNEQFNNLAAQSPNAVLAFFNTTAPTQVSSQSSINTAGLQPQVDAVPTFMENGIERIRLNAPAKSVLMGAGHTELKAEADRHRQAVFQKYGVTF